MKKRLLVFILGIVLLIATLSSSSDVYGHDFDRKTSYKLARQIRRSKHKEITVLVKFNNDVYETYDEMNNREEVDYSIDYSDQEVKQIKAFEREYLRQRNEEVLGSIVNTLHSEYDILFKSDYLPYILIKTNGFGVKNLIELDCVENISIQSEKVRIKEPINELGLEGHQGYVETISSSSYLDAINASDIYQDYGVDGSGVNIGIMEPGRFYLGLANDMNILHEETDSYTYPGKYYTKTRIIPFNKHKSTVALLIGGDDAGIAPESNILSLDLFVEDESTDETYLSEVMSEFERYLDIELADGTTVSADIINCSYELTSYEDYDDLSIFLDDFIATTKTVVVAASGNSGGRSAWKHIHNLEYTLGDDEYECVDNKIHNIQRASNVITVGSTTLDGTKLSDFSSFDSGQYVKPTIVAPGGSNFTRTSDLSNYVCPPLGCEYVIENRPLYVIDSPYSEEKIVGTSFSTPLVTGSIALLMDYSPNLKLHPEEVIALLSLGASYDNITIPIEEYNDITGLISYSTSPLTIDSTSGLSVEVGAGLLNVDKSLDLINNSEVLSYATSSTSVGNVVATKTLFLSYGSTVRISHAYLRNQDVVNFTNVDMSDYNVKLVYELGSGAEVVLKQSSSSDSNFELFEYPISTSGYYRIDVYIQDANLVFSQYGYPYSTFGTVYIEIE